MKKILSIIAAVCAFSLMASAYDRPVTFQQLPEPARQFITSNFPGDDISYATVDDDLIRPDYNVLLVSGVKLQFANSGALEKIEVKTGIPSDLIPVQIRDYVKTRYPDAFFVEYEVGKRVYEVKLSNRLEFKFNRNFHIVEVDD